jgi:hypothetical protein
MQWRNAEAEIKPSDEALTNLVHGRTGSKPVSLLPGVVDEKRDLV